VKSRAAWRRKRDRSATSCRQARLLQAAICSCAWHNRQAVLDPAQTFHNKQADDARTEPVARAANECIRALSRRYFAWQLARTQRKRGRGFFESFRAPRGDKA